MLPLATLILILHLSTVLEITSPILLSSTLQNPYSRLKNPPVPDSDGETPQIPKEINTGALHERYTSVTRALHERYTTVSQVVLLLLVQSFAVSVQTNVGGELQQYKRFSLNIKMGLIG